MYLVIIIIVLIMLYNNNNIVVIIIVVNFNRINQIFPMIRTLFVKKHEIYKNATGRNTFSYNNSCVLLGWERSLLGVHSSICDFVGDTFQKSWNQNVWWLVYYSTWGKSQCCLLLWAGAAIIGAAINPYAVNWSCVTRLPGWNKTG